MQNNWVGIVFVIAVGLLFRSLNVRLWLWLLSRDIPEAPLSAYRLEVYVPKRVRAGLYPGSILALIWLALGLAFAVALGGKPSEALMLFTVLGH
jgi:hypothetical protein